MANSRTVLFLAILIVGVWYGDARNCYSCFGKDCYNGTGNVQECQEEEGCRTCVATKDHNGRKAGEVIYKTCGSPGMKGVSVPDVCRTFKGFNELEEEHCDCFGEDVCNGMGSENKVPCEIRTAGGGTCTYS